MACVHLCWLAMTCAHFGRDQIRTQVKASSSPFGHPTQVNPSWVTPINLLLANEIRYMSALKWVSLQLACTCAETCQCVWPPNASPYASSTCVLLRLLAGPFDQYFIIEKHDVVPKILFRDIFYYTHSWFRVDALFTSHVLQWPSSSKTELMSTTWRI